VKALVLDGSEKMARIFQDAELFEVFIAYPRMTWPDTLIHSTDQIEGLNEFLKRFSVAVKIQEEHSIVIEVLSGAKYFVEMDHVDLGSWYRYSVDLETGVLFPEFQISEQTAPQE